MARTANRKVIEDKSIMTFLDHRVKEGLLIVGSAMSLFVLVALVSFHPHDPGFSHSGLSQNVANIGGPVGAWVADVLFWLCGYFAYLLPISVTYLMWLFFHRETESSEHAEEAVPWLQELLSLRTLGFALTLATGCALASVFFHDLATTRFDTGGILGNVLGEIMLLKFHPFGACLMLTAFFLVGVTLATGISWIDMAEQLGFWVSRTIEGFRQGDGEVFDAPEEVIEPVSQKPMAKKDPVISTEMMSNMAQKKEPTLAIPHAKVKISGKLPSLTLLTPPKLGEAKRVAPSKLEEMSRLLEKTLKDFGIKAEVVGVNPGPVVTRFEVNLAAGTKASKVSGLAKDIARSLSMTSVRVVEVISGKSVIGLELPNTSREMVRLRDVLASKQYAELKSPLALGLGKDISGHPVSVDLAKMPHLLVAGTTGSGKSVGMNAMLLSMLYKATPEQLRLILIDPKMLELSVYEGIPHLLAPVVTDMRQAGNALRWCVGEMERRYKLMASMGVRNIAGYNAKIVEGEEKGEPLLDPFFDPGAHAEGATAEPLQTLPCIVVLADEFADMIMVVGKKVEELITRIAQKARAAGIHLILATQRPSVDVITGLIKANVPARIAFQVSSRIDSRTILDQGGADQLLGHGDMLYLAPGTGLPIRVHGAYVDDEEVHRVVADLKRRGAPQYLDEILSGGSGGEFDTDGEGDTGSGGADPEQDILYDQAVQIVIQTRRASISNIQRRLKIGYNRAARIVDAMEVAGLVSPMDGSGGRQVLAPESAEA